MLGRIFSIEEFSVYDGPGIRTTVFFKGCPLRCNWCHSPEGQEFKKEILKNKNGCVHCGACDAICENKGQCITCGKCIQVCPKNLIRICGEDYEVDALVAKLSKNIDILNLNGGGITFSGGDPLFQCDFLYEVLKKLKGKTNLAIQTSGFCKSEDFKKILSVADYFLFDLKIIDEEKAKYYTGQSSKLILENFKLLKESGVPFVVRVPLIPTVTDTKENLKAIANLVGGKGFIKVELEPYNKFAGSKYALNQKVYQPLFDETIPPNIDVEIFKERNIEVSVY